MSKSILIDATHFGTKQPTGVELYVNELLPRISSILQNHDVTVSWVAHEFREELPGGVEAITSPYSKGWGQRALTKLLREKKPDLFFTPSGIPPYFSPVATAMTVHDLSYYDNPQSYSFPAKIRLNAVMPRVAMRSSLILVPSEFVKNDITNRWRISSAKIMVTYLAESLAKEEEIVSLPNVQFAFFVGRIELKKNLIPLVKALAEVPELHLVCAGRDGYGAEEVRRAILQLPQEVQNRIHLIGYISQAQKRWLYLHSRLTVVPGMGEGFGMSVLEAFRLGSPVIVSASGSLPEIADNGAILVQGDDVEEWRRALMLIQSDETVRKDLISRGHERSNQFSWDRCAEETARALLAVL